MIRYLVPLLQLLLLLSLVSVMVWTWLVWFQPLLDAVALPVL